MGTIANAKVTHYYNCYNKYFIGCLIKSQICTTNQITNRCTNRFISISNRY